MNAPSIISGLLASVYVSQRDLVRAETLLKTLLKPDTPDQTISQRLAWYAQAELALATGKPGLALQIADQLTASARNSSDQSRIPHLLKLKGVALISLHELAESEAVLEAAKEAATQRGLRPLLWRIQVALGNLYQAQARREEAEDAYLAARLTIDDLAAGISNETLRTTFLQGATELLPRADPLSPRRALQKEFGGLTDREREVATLIGKGKSNRDIAEALVVGYRTVETHVSHILSKLNFTSRAQIAVWAVEKGLVQSADN